MTLIALPAEAGIFTLTVDRRIVVHDDPPYEMSVSIVNVPRDNCETYNPWLGFQILGRRRYYQVTWYPEQGCWNVDFFDPIMGAIIDHSRRVYDEYEMLQVVRQLAEDHEDYVNHLRRS